MDSTCVMNSLRSKILQRNPDIVADFTPKPSTPMTLYELEKDRRRKESNRRSARMSRLKLKDEDKKNQKLLDQEYDKRNVLMNKLKLLENSKQKQLEALRRTGVSETLIQEHLQKARVTYQRDISTSQTNPPGTNLTAQQLASVVNLRANKSGNDQTSGASTPSYSYGSRSSSPSYESVAQTIYRADMRSASSSPYSSLASTDTDDTFRNVYTEPFSSGSPSLVSESCDEDRGDFNLDRSGDEDNDNIMPSFTNHDIMMTLAHSLTGYKDYDLEMKDV